MAKGVPAKQIRRTILSILAAQPRKIRWGESLTLLGLALGCGSWLYMLLNPTPRFYVGLLLALGCSASFCGALCLVITGHKGLKSFLCIAAIITSFVLYVIYGGPLIKNQPDTLTVLGRIEQMLKELPDTIVDRIERRAAKTTSSQKVPKQPPGTLAETTKPTLVPLDTATKGKSIPRTIPDRQPRTFGRSNLVLRFIGKEKPLFYLECMSDESANRPAYYFGVWDLDKPYYYKTIPNVIQALPITSRFDDGFVFHGKKAGLAPVLNPLAAEHVKLGDHLFGMAAVYCLNCKNEHAYWFYFKMGYGGWYAPMSNEPEGQQIQVPVEGQTEDQQNSVIDKVVPRAIRLSMPNGLK